MSGVTEVTGDQRRSRRVPGTSVQRRRLAIVAGIVLAVVLGLLLLRGCGGASTVTVVAVGDMSCDATDPAQRSPAAGRATDRCQGRSVSDAAVALKPDYLLGLGDYLYEMPTSASYRQIYGPTWGRLREVTVPAIGNQEYKVHDANTFFDYFGDRAPERLGYWSTDVGAWHVVVLNSNCTTVAGGCAKGSPQQRWLEQDLAQDTTRCTVALMHHPRWSTGIAGPDQRGRDLVATLVGHRVELVLSGHEADYERFAPRDAAGRATPTGITQLVAGAGGQAHYEPSVGDAPWRAGKAAMTSAFFDGAHHGFLELVLEPAAWKWRYHALIGSADTVVDHGSASCG